MFETARVYQYTIEVDTHADTAIARLTDNSILKLREENYGIATSRA